MRSPEEIVDDQIEAYVRRDGKAFAAFYELDAVCGVLGTDEVIARGRAEIETVWTRSLGRSAFEFRLANRIVNGRYVVDHEVITFPDASVIQAVAVYLVGPELIRQVWFLRTPASASEA